MWARVFKLWVVTCLKLWFVNGSSVHHVLWLLVSCSCRWIGVSVFSFWCASEADRLSAVGAWQCKPSPAGGVCASTDSDWGCLPLHSGYSLAGLVIKASASRRPWDTLACCWDVKQPTNKQTASRAEDPVFESRLRRDLFGVESYQWLKNWHSSGYPARRLAL